jgi:large subunit ribosomal protein L10
MLTRQQKEEIVEKLSAEIKEAPACVLADFKGFGANDMVVLKRELRNTGSTFQIIKKKLLAIALKNNGIDLDVKAIDGQIAISVSADEVSSAKIIYNTGKENENMKIVGGILDNNLMSVEEMQRLAKLPSTEELRGQLVGQLQAPISGFVNTLSAVPRSFVQVLKAVADSKEA